MMNWTKNKNRAYGRSIAAALIFFSAVLLPGNTAQASLGWHEDVEVTEDGFELNAKGTAVIGYEGDGGDIVIPDGVTTIAADTFSGEESITGVDLNEVKTIGNNAFAQSGLEEVENADEVRVIGDKAFAETKLTVFSVPSELLELADTAFDGVTTLRSFSGGSRNYPVYGGCIYAEEGELLYIEPEGKDASVTVARAADEDSEEELADEEDGMDWIDIDAITARTGRYAVVEHSLDTYDVNGGNTSSGSNANSSSSSGNTSNTSGTASSSSAATGSTSGTENSSLNSASTSDASASAGTSSSAGNTVKRSLDTTPKTADGDIDPKFVFCAALFLIGLAGLLFVRQKGLVQLASRRSVADSGELD